MSYLELDRIFDEAKKSGGELSKIRQSSTGIEAVVGAVLYLIWPPFLSF
jgi:hypothetical protein